MVTALAAVVLAVVKANAPILIAAMILPIPVALFYRLVRFGAQFAKWSTRRRLAPDHALSS